MRSNTRWAILIGIGLALSPIHNIWFTELVTNSRGVTQFFLPAFGTAVWIMASLMFVAFTWRKGDSWTDWAGNPQVYVPLLIIILFMGISGFKNPGDIGAKTAPFLMGVSLFAVYSAGRRLGAMMLKPLVPLVVMGALLAIIFGLLSPGIPADKTGGLITNYAANAGFLLLGAVVTQGKWQWLLALLVVTGVFFIGAIEAAFIVSVMGLTLVLRRDFSYRLALIVAPLAILIGLWLALGNLVPLYEGNGNVRMLLGLLSHPTPLTGDALSTLTSGRWPVLVNAIKDVSLFGHGYSLGTASGQIVHNIPLIIIHQLGVVAGLAWLAVTVYCLIFTRWKYTWTMILAMGVFDHYIWTQFAPFWWALVGISTTSPIRNDLIFRQQENSAKALKQTEA